MASESSDGALISRVFGITVRRLRKGRGMAQERFALDTGVDRAHMSALERGLHRPTLETIFKLLPVLGINFTDFAREYERILAKERRGSRKRHS